jgi:sporulation protein YlmC with PRC-barrel domain
MTRKLSELYGMDIFTDKGKFLVTSQEFLLDVEKGSVARILLDRITGSRESLKEVLRNKSVKYENVRSVEDVIVVAAEAKPA